MDPASRDLLDGWISGVLARADHHCGVFIGDDGQPFGPRARPWDYPDILVSGGVHDDALVLELSDGSLRLHGVHDVVPGTHPWGPGLRVTGTIDDVPTEVWLV
ncbi:MAG: hypothetical protein B7C55_07610 [Actinomycetales bacterium mxb001]|nr:MAG: hypothetical protein B7C55_07610 [Actinomycetales bacterium mxb001]